MPFCYSSLSSTLISNERMYSTIFSGCTRRMLDPLKGNKFHGNSSRQNQRPGGSDHPVFVTGHPGAFRLRFRETGFCRAPVGWNRMETRTGSGRTDPIHDCAPTSRGAAEVVLAAERTDTR